MGLTLTVEKTMITTSLQDKYSGCLLVVQYRKSCMKPLSDTISNKVAEYTLCWKTKSMSELLNVSFPNLIHTVDRDIFVLKIIHVKIFHVDKFSRFHLIREKNFTVDDCNMDECLESLWLLVNYQVSGEPGIAHCSRLSDIYLGECGLARKLVHWSSPHNFIFHVFNFCGWSRPRNYFNSEIFPIYGTLPFCYKKKASTGWRITHTHTDLPKKVQNKVNK